MLCPTKECVCTYLAQFFFSFQKVFILYLSFFLHSSVNYEFFYLDVKRFVYFLCIYACLFLCRWVRITKRTKIINTTLLVIEGATCYDYLSWESACPNLLATDVRVEMISPASYDGNVIEELCAVPLTKLKRQELEKSKYVNHENNINIEI